MGYLLHNTKYDIKSIQAIKFCSITFTKIFNNEVIHPSINIPNKVLSVI